MVARRFLDEHTRGSGSLWRRLTTFLGAREKAVDELKTTVRNDRTRSTLPRVRSPGTLAAATVVSLPTQASHTKRRLGR